MNQEDTPNAIFKEERARPGTLYRVLFARIQHKFEVGPRRVVSIAEVYGFLGSGARLTKAQTRQVLREFEALGWIKRNKRGIILLRESPNDFNMPQKPENCGNSPKALLNPVQDSIVYSNSRREENGTGK